MSGKSAIHIRIAVGGQPEEVAKVLRLTAEALEKKGDKNAVEGESSKGGGDSRPVGG